MHGLYIHIPYCVRKCIYCDFYSVETSSAPLAQRLKEEIPDQPDFLAALEQEFQDLPDGFKPATIFLGGGTPTELSDADFNRLMDLIHQTIDVRRVREWTCESNPGTLSQAKIESMKEAGVNRVSLGVQTLSPKLLDFLGRVHSAEEAEEGFHKLRQAGFTNINLDFIYGIPGGEENQVLQDAERAIRLGPDHLSFYCLMFEEGTPLLQLKKSGFVKEADDETQRIQYEQMCKFLETEGYGQYELSNFAQSGRECLHNRLYWYCCDYIGCGPSAHSHWKGQRWSNQRTLKKYFNSIHQIGHARTGEECLDTAARAREHLVIGLRQTRGLRLPRFQARTGWDAMDLAGPTIDRFLAQGWLEQDQDRLRLSPDARFISDALFSELV